MKVLVIGSGGREHALCWGLKQSPTVEEVFCAPGNGGIGWDVTNVDLNPSDHQAVIDFCRKREITLVVVGPEQPLTEGLADSLREAGVLVFGPSAEAARLEGSKAFTKYICDTYGIPTAKWQRFTELEAARDYVREQGAPIVVKADGLAAGKGVTVAMTEGDAITALEEMFAGKFGDAGQTVVIEEFMEGEEASFFALVDGERAIEFGYAQDHKRVGEGDTGLNTGGMGTYSPAPVLTETLRKQVMHTIIEPTVKGMKEEGCSYQGILYAGLMLTADGPKLVEYNVRFGDPEAQVLIPRLESDLAMALRDAAEGRLEYTTVRSCPEACVCVVLAAKGYPGAYEKGSVIRGIEAAEATRGVKVFHAGTKIENGKLLANGGRVLGVTALGATIGEAQRKAYEAVDKIDWPEGFCRRDIAWRAIKSEVA